MAKQTRAKTLPQDETSKPAQFFDRSILAHHAMNDVQLADELMKLFLTQLAHIESMDWDKPDLGFEMHTLQGAAAAVGARQIQQLAQDWHSQRQQLKAAMKAAIVKFRQEARKS